MDLNFFMSESGPVSQLNYKRAILRATPQEFTIEILTPVKHGGNYSYGVKVCPISRPISDSRSISSRTSSHTEYDIWRRWEDCLDFQNTLEYEYEQLSRQKVRVLKRGGKKPETRSIYSQARAASSFDSLPEGPDPREIAVNVHDLIPPLAKRGTLFRPSRATIEQRGTEFEAMMRGLFNPDPEAPVLLRQLRNCEPVRNFFAYWRRDQEIAEKYGPKTMHSNRSLSSILPSPSQQKDYPPLPTPPPSAPFPPTPFTQAHITDTAHIKQYATTVVLDAQSSQINSQIYDDSHRPVLLADSLVNQRVSRSSTVDSTMSFRPDISTLELTDSSRQLDPWQSTGVHNITPIDENVEYNSQHRSSQWSTSPRPPPIIRRPSNSDTLDPKATRRPRSNSSTVPGHRDACPQSYTTEPRTSPPTRRLEGQSAPQQHSPQTSFSHPLHSFSSNPSLRERHDKSLKYPPSSSPNFSQTSISSRFSAMSLHRSSVNSSVSGHTYASKTSQQNDTTYDGEFDYNDITGPVLHSSPLSAHRTLLSNIDESDSLALQDCRKHRGSVSSIRTEASADGVLPPHLREVRGIEDERSERESHSATNAAQRSGLYSSPSIRKGSIRDSNHHRYSGSSMSSSSSYGDTLAIKATYHDHIIMFRADRSSTLRDIRQRVQERLALHESVSVQASFVLTYTPSWSSSSQRAYNNADMSTSDNLRVLQNDQDWQTALSTCSNGIIRIRVLDSEVFPRYF